jgi:hypothetical protein
LRIRAKPWLFLPALAAATAAIIFSIHSYRYRFVRSEADMLALLPKRDMTIFFAEVALLRHAGMLNLLAGSKATADPDYADFLRQTRFDYEKDLDTIAAAADGRQIFFILHGRFDWTRLRQYAIAHGGSCANDICKASTSKPGRWAGFFPIQPDVMALALSEDSAAVNVLRPDRRKAPEALPDKPVWIKFSKSLLKDPRELPAAGRIFAISLQSSDSVVLSIERAGEQPQVAFYLQLDALCPNQPTAETTRNQLQIQTNMLKLGLARANQQPNPADLTGLVTTGTFQLAGKHVIGRWPVRKELLKALQ